MFQKDPVTQASLNAIATTVWATRFKERAQTRPYVSVLPVLYLVVKLMLYLAISGKYSGVLICPDCKRSSLKFHMDHRYVKGPVSIYDYRDVVCPFCNRFICSVCDYILDTADSREGAQVAFETLC